MSLNKVFLTLLANIFIIVLLLLVFLQRANFLTWLIIMSVFTTVVFIALLILRIVFNNFQYHFVRLILTMVAAFITAVLATAFSFICLPNDGYTFAKIIESSFGIAIVGNIALFWFWGILAGINFTIYSINIPIKKANRGS